MGNKVGGLVALGVVGLIVVAFLGMLMSANNRAASMEQGIIAAHDDSRNILGQLAPKIKEALGVTKMQTKALEDIIRTANETRKLNDDAVMQWVQEQNPQLDQSGYTKVIAIVEAARNDFANKQTDKLERVRVYRTALKRQPMGFFYGMAGYPTGGEAFFAKYGEIVTSSHSQEAFRTGTDDGIDIQ